MRKRDIKAHKKAMQVAQKGKLLPKKKGKGGVWKDDEFDRLLEAIRLFGKDWAQVS